MKTFKRALLIVLIMLCTVSAIPEEFRDYANQVRQKIELLEEINERRNEVIADQGLTIEEQKNQMEKIQEEADLAIADAKEANLKSIEKDLKIQKQNRLLRIFTLILVVKVLGSIALLVLHYKYHITVPYFLNTLF